MRKRKIKFPLILKDNTKVRTLEDLRQFFDLDKIIGYYADGKLEIWLRDRYEDEIAEEISELDKNDPSIAELICNALGVSADNTASISIADVQSRNEKNQKLRMLTDDANVINNSDKVVFTQTELDDLLRTGTDVVYLYGESFVILPQYRKLKVIGLKAPENNPKIDSQGHTMHEYQALDMTFENAALIKKSPAYGKEIGDIIKLGTFVSDDTIKFGTFVSDDIIEPGTCDSGELKWKIIAINEDSALLLCERVVKIMQYLTQGSSWKKSLIREWLKNYFYNTSFTDAEKELIINDDIFILNKEEVEKYSKNPEERIAYLTHDIQQIAMSPLKSLFSELAELVAVNRVFWWLRDDPDSLGFVQCINGIGNIQFTEVANHFGVRPAMWISL